MSDGEWENCTSSRDVKRRKKLEEKKKKRQEEIDRYNKFQDIYSKYPHVVDESAITDIRRIYFEEHGHSIDGLFDFFKKDEVIDLQIEGWKYDQIVRFQDIHTFDKITDCQKLLDIGNEWGDKVLFTK